MSTNNLKPQNAKSLVKTDESVVNEEEIEFSATEISKLSKDQLRALRGDTEEDSDEISMPSPHAQGGAQFQSQNFSAPMKLDPADRDALVQKIKYDAQLAFKEQEVQLRLARERQLQYMEMVEKQVTEILYSLQQKTKGIQEDLVRVQNAIRSIKTMPVPDVPALPKIGGATPPQAPAKPQAAVPPQRPTATPPQAQPAAAKPQTATPGSPAQPPVKKTA